jgi:malate permease and related proteins
MYDQLIPIIAPVLVCTAVGYVWALLKLPMDREFMTLVIMNVGTPCLILQGISGLPTGNAGFLQMVALGSAVHAGCGVLGFIGLRLLGQPVRSYLPVIIFGNSTNMGLPLCMFAFGQEGLGLGVGYVLVGSVGQFVLGPMVQGRMSPWRTLAQTPVIYAAVLGLGLLLAGVQLPRWAANTVGLFGGLAIPLMLLALGSALATISVSNVRTAVSLGLARIACGFVLAFGLTEALGLTGPLRGALLIQSSMPVAVFSYLFAARYDRHPEDAAGAILLSTCLSFLTMPALVIFALAR